MLLSLKSNHRQHLIFLISQSSQVLIDFCKLALDYMQNGENTKRYQVAAQKLNVTVNVIQNAVEGLVNLSLESCKHNLSESDFSDSVAAIGFKEEQIEILKQFYLTKQNEVKNVLKKFAVTSPHYHDLNWRFEVELGSRSLVKQVNPVIAMELILQEKPNINSLLNEKESSTSKVLLQTDPCNLLHMTKVLEQALAETRTQHFKKVQRMFKHV